MLVIGPEGLSGEEPEGTETRSSGVKILRAEDGVRINDEDGHAVQQRTGACVLIIDGDKLHIAASDRFDLATALGDESVIEDDEAPADEPAGGVAPEGAVEHEPTNAEEHETTEAHVKPPSPSARTAW
jgi:hypothetical protein